MYKLLRVSYIIVVAYLFCGIFFFLSVPSSLCYLNLSNAKMETHFQLFSHQWKCIINKYSSKRFKKGGGGGRRDDMESQGRRDDMESQQFI